MAQWVGERDAILRGLTHALSNRVGTVAAVAGIVVPGEPVPEAIAAALQSETARLERVLALLRLLPLDGETPPEPLYLPDLVPTVVELHGHHGALREAPCAVEPDPMAPPVLAPHSALAHALLVLLAAGARRAGEARLRWTGDDDRVAVTVADAAAAAPAAAWLLRGAATVRVDGDGDATIVLPSLGAARREAGG